MWIDSHCHINGIDADNLPTVMANAKEAGVLGMLCIGTEGVDSQRAVALAHQFPEVVAAVGWHPSESTSAFPDMDLIATLANDDRVVAIGETGLDYHYHRAGHEIMQDAFAAHIALACQVGKPLVIHSRDAREDTIAILRSEQASRVSGVMHCFTEDWAMAKQALDLGFYISISGIVTFNNASQVVEVAKNVPIDRLLIETDAPYLAPVPYRGKPNQPAWVVAVGEAIAHYRGLPLDELRRQTSNNFFRLFSPQSNCFLKEV